MNIFRFSISVLLGSTFILLSAWKPTADQIIRPDLLTILGVALLISPLLEKFDKK